MTTNYDPIAEQYKRSKQQAWRTFVECFTLMELVGDPRELAGTDQFDLAMAAYLLNYARNRGGLQSMCDGIARSLKPGGRFVTVNCNPSQSFPTAPSYRKYGFETSVEGEWQEGQPIKWTFHLSDGPFDIENYHLNMATHEEAFPKAGFREIRWHAPKLSPEGLLSNDLEYWADLLGSPPVAFIECVK